MKYIVNVSGGWSSYEALCRTVDKHGREDTVPVFADTQKEDADLHRFLRDQERLLGVTIVRLSDGRTPFEVVRDERMITIRGMAKCSILLKHDVIDNWIAERYASPYLRIFGMDWTEQGRMDRLRERLAPIPVWFPLAEPPYVTKEIVFAKLRSVGVEPPRLYEMGFKHNNCGGMCIKAGQAHWAHLLKMLPDRYAEAEAEEESFRQYVGKDVSILKDRSNKQSKPLTLRAFRERLQCGGSHNGDWGMCGCYVQLPLDDELGRDALAHSGERSER